MAAHVSLAAGPPVLIGDVPATIAALAERVKEVPHPFLSHLSMPTSSHACTFRFLGP